MPSAEIITIGTEILLGEIVDTNTRYIARVLRGMGVNLFRTMTIGDNAERIADVIRDAMQRAEIGEVISGKKTGRQSDNEITFFKSVGNAVQDATAAQLALMNARTMKLGVEVEF